MLRTRGHSLFYCSVLLVLLRLAGPTEGCAATPAERLLSAISSSSLDTPGLKPWHLKLDVTVYDDVGSHPTSGTIERWQSSDADRTVYTFGDATVTHLNANGKSYTMHNGGQIPALADAVLDETLHPGPAESNLQHVEPDVRTQSFGTVKLDCIMLMHHLSHAQMVPLGLFPTYCLTQADDRLRFSYNFGSFGVMRNGIGTFQGRDVATDLTLKQQQVTVAHAKITTLETFTPADQFTLDPAMQSTAINAARVAGGVMAGHILTKTQPIYPVNARVNHVSGTVVLHAIISRDGHVRYLRPESTPDVELTIAALDAVRRWTYAPYLLNGEPTEVDTTVVVNFNLSPR